MGPKRGKGRFKVRDDDLGRFPPLEWQGSKADSSPGPRSSRGRSRYARKDARPPSRSGHATGRIADERGPQARCSSGRRRPDVQPCVASKKHRREQGCRQYRDRQRSPARCGRHERSLPDPTAKGRNTRIGYGRASQRADGALQRCAEPRSWSVRGVVHAASGVTGARPSRRDLRLPAAPQE